MCSEPEDGLALRGSRRVLWVEEGMEGIAPMEKRKMQKTINLLWPVGPSEKELICSCSPEKKCLVGCDSQVV